jgi:hypothetical protein
MDEITRNLVSGVRTFRIYTKEEADELKIRYKPWREVDEGEWALSDDGYVAECYMVRRYEARRRRRKTQERFIRLAFGAYWVSKNSRCVYGIRRSTGDYSSSRPQPWGERESRRRIVKTIVKMYALMYIRNNVDWRKLGVMFRPKDRIPEASAKKLFKQPEIKEMVEKELKKIFTDNGVDEKYVLDLYKDVVAKAKDKEQLTTMLRVADTLADMLRMTSEAQIATPPSGRGLLAGMVIDERTAELMDSEDRKLREIESARKREGKDGIIEDADFSDPV